MCYIRKRREIRFYLLIKSRDDIIIFILSI